MTALPDTQTTASTAPEHQRYDGVFDEGRHPRARLGFVLLAMEQTIDSDLVRMAPEGVGIHITRAAMANSVTVDTLTDMLQHIRPAAKVLLPELEFDVVCYACTSGTVVNGEEAVERELAAGAHATHHTSLLGGVREALTALNAQRVSVVTPYVDGINQLEAAYLEEHGFQVDSLHGLEIEFDMDIARVSPAFLADYAQQHTHPDSDALFISCGALRSIEIIDELEQRIGKPVITSNQAMMWHCLRLAGVTDPLDDLGVLFREH